jgi:ABC-2 type transport system permease protein
MSRGRLLRAYLIEAKYESLRMLREPAFAGPFLVLPAALYLLFAVLLFGESVAKDPGASLFLLIGFAVFGVMGPGMFGFGVSIATERDRGLLQLKRALPTPPGSVLLAKMAMSMLFVAIIMVTMFAAGIPGHVKLGIGQMVSASAVSIFGALPFCAIGLFIGTLVSGKSAPAFVNLAYLPMIYLSGFLIPLPKSMHWIALASPAYHLHQAVLAAVGTHSEGSAWVHVAILAVLTLALTALSIRRLARIG